jgi:hypothetical protein
MADDRHSESRAGASTLTWLALALSLIGVAGSLWLSLGMGLRACPLCFYQRTFVMSVCAILLIGLLGRAAPGGALSRLALPLGLAALGVSGFHVWLEYNGTLECPDGILGVGSSPQQALAIIVAMTIVLFIDVVRFRPSTGVMFAIVGIIVGGGLAYGSIVSSPPIPPAPDAPYTALLDICRPPYAGGD